MKILFVNKFLYPKGGSETYMFELAELLRRQGASTAFWGMSDKKNIVADEYAAFAENVDYTFTAGFRNKVRSCFSIIYSIDNRRKIAQVLKKFRPDIVHIHNYNFQLTPSILPVIKDYGAGIVHTIHDTQLVCPCHRFYNSNDNVVCTSCANASFWHCVRHRCFDGSLFKSIVGAAESYIYHNRDYYNRYIDAFISPSRFLAGWVAPRVRRKIYVVPNFTQDRSSGMIPEGARDYVLYVGRISAEKGILEAQSIFEQAGVKLVVIGTGPQQDALKSSDFIEYLGPKYGDELLKYIAGAKFVVQPSRVLENCPMTVIESFMCSTPVIASPKGGLTEMIQNGINGFLFDFNDPADINYLRKILQMDTTRMRLLCRKTYLEKYSPKKHLSQIELVYGEVLNGR